MVSRGSGETSSSGRPKTGRGKGASALIAEGGRVGSRRDWVWHARCRATVAGGSGTAALPHVVMWPSCGLSKGAGEADRWDGPLQQ
jgi:hypothetical protein